MSRNDDTNAEREERIRQLMERAQRQLHAQKPLRAQSGSGGRVKSKTAKKPGGRKKTSR